MDNDWEPLDEECPNCHGWDTRRRDCYEPGCEDGWVDVYDEDPLWYDPGDVEPCHNCDGDGYFAWCADCGYDFVEKRVIA